MVEAENDIMIGQKLIRLMEGAVSDVEAGAAKAFNTTPGHLVPKQLPHAAVHALMSARNPAKAGMRSIARLVQLLVVLLALGGGLAGCGKKDVVEPLKRPEEVRAALEKEKAAKKNRAAREQQARAPRRPSRATTTPAPTPSPTPVVDYTPVVIDAAKMASDKGEPDPEGGKKLSRNGFLQMDNVEVSFPISEVLLEMKGSPLGKIWPEVDLNMYNRSAKKNFFPWPRDYVTTNTFHPYSRRVDPPMPPGTYLITFRYYNDTPSEDSHEDRAVTVRRIELRP